VWAKNLFFGIQIPFRVRVGTRVEVNKIKAYSLKKNIFQQIMRVQSTERN